MEKLRKKGHDIQPVRIEGRKIARTFWGAGWCDHLESFSDFENRLPRGRTYVRNGSVCHLAVDKGRIEAFVSGSDLYKVRIEIDVLPEARWSGVKSRCAGQIGSLLELLQGRLSESVMSVVTDREEGLFPLPGEIRLGCSCPDWAVMCKHVAAVLYGVGARLDARPELLFLLRGVDHVELIAAEADLAAATGAERAGGRRRLADDDLAGVFGIDISQDDAAAAKASQEAPKTAKAGKKAPKPKAAKPKKQPTRTRKTPGRKKSPAKTVGSASNVAAKAEVAPPPTGPATGQIVLALREQFGMSRGEFARLVGVSAPSIVNWETREGPLNLQSRTLKKLNAARTLTKAQAWAKLKGG